LVQSDVFIAIKETEHELSYHSNATDESRNNEANVAIKLLNIIRTFEAKLPTYYNCPPSPMPYYYVEMANSLGTIVNNHEEN
jgi:hypothetical protein